MKNTLLLFTFLTLLSSCTDEELIETSWNYSEFKSIDSYQPFEDVKPAYDFDYWELIKHTTDHKETIQFRFGVICKDSNNPRKCTYDFFRMDDTGINFNYDPKNSRAYYYLKSNQQDYNKTWNSVDELKAFLGIIDSEGDALLLAAANGYFFAKDDRYMSGIRKKDDGYDVIGLKTISTCEPLQINKFLLQIDKNGNIKAKDEIIFIDDQKKCIDN